MGDAIPTLQIFANSTQCLPLRGRPGNRFSAPQCALHFFVFLPFNPNWYAFVCMKKPEPPVTGVAHRMPRTRPGDADPRIRAVRAIKRKLTIAASVVAIVILCLFFPRALAFVELAAREIRYLWWLIAILALGLWLAFFFGKKRE